MKKVYYLSTCSTCKRILGELDPGSEFILQDIKTEPVTGVQLDAMAALSGSYEALFSRRAIKFRTMGLADRELGETDYRDLILSEYTFLKRPVIVFGDSIFIGSSAKVVQSLKDALTK